MCFYTTVLFQQGNLKHLQTQTMAQCKIFHLVFFLTDSNLQSDAENVKWHGTETWFSSWRKQTVRDSEGIDFSQKETFPTTDYKSRIVS